MMPGSQFLAAFLTVALTLCKWQFEAIPRGLRGPIVYSLSTAVFALILINIVYCSRTNYGRTTTRDLSDADG